jgi:hypothetical protein
VRICAGGDQRWSSLPRQALVFRNSPLVRAIYLQQLGSDQRTLVTTSTMRARFRSRCIKPVPAGETSNSNAGTQASRRNIRLSFSYFIGIFRHVASLSSGIVFGSYGGKAVLALQIDLKRLGLFSRPWGGTV